MASPIKTLQEPVEIYFDQTLGMGSYGLVCKAKCGQLPCAAKLLHQTLLQCSGVYNYASKFENECQFLSALRHPNIVQYLGTTKEKETGRPVLFMELLDESLTSHLEGSPGPLPYHRQLEISYDIALALSYLHSNSILHRDLSSNNVLLLGRGGKRGSTRAKLTDFGLYKLVSTSASPYLSPLASHGQGTLVYMAPEVLLIPPHFSSAMDCFSCGVLVLQILTRSFPSPGDAHKSLDDDDAPDPSRRHVVVQYPEIERRKKDIERVESDHPLLSVALSCLKDRAKDRPSADKLCETLASLKKDVRYMESQETKNDGDSSLCTLKEELEARELLEREMEAQLGDYKVEVEKLAKELEEAKHFLKEQRSNLEQVKAMVRESAIIEVQTNQDEKVGELEEEITVLQSHLEECRSKLESSEEAGRNEKAAIQEKAEEHQREVERLKEELVAMKSLVEEHQPQPKPKRRATFKDRIKRKTSFKKASFSTSKLPEFTTRQEGEGMEAGKEEDSTKSDSEAKLPGNEQSLTDLQPPPSTSSPPPAMKWRQGSEAPEFVSGLNGAAVVDGDTAYISHYFTLYSYHLAEDKWKKLADSQFQSFGLAVLDHNPTTISGISRDKRRTKTLFSLVKKGAKWEEKYPPMPTHRVCAAAMTTPTHLVVAGGRDRAELRTVEVMSKDSLQWSKATDLPQPMGHLQMTLCNGTIYVCNQQAVYSSSLEYFLHTSHSGRPSSTGKAPPMWSKLPDVPTESGHTLCTLGNRVLVIGGCRQEGGEEKATGTICGYDAASSSWGVEGEIPTARLDAVAVVLCGGEEEELVVVGGWSDSDTYKLTEIAMYQATDSTH